MPRLAGRLVSPNDLQEAAEKQMLGGRKPETHEDWVLCANFWAANTLKGMENCIPVLGLILQCPLTGDELREIAKFQEVRK